MTIHTWRDSALPGVGASASVFSDSLTLLYAKQIEAQRAAERAEGELDMYLRLTDDLDVDRAFADRLVHTAQEERHGLALGTGVANWPGPPTSEDIQRAEQLLRDVAQMIRKPEMTHTVLLRTSGPFALAAALDAARAAAADCEGRIASIVASAGREFLHATQATIALSRYHHLAAALGVGRETARRILKSSQGPFSGWVPNNVEIEHAERVLRGVATLVWTFPQRSQVEEHHVFKRLPAGVTRHLARSAPLGPWPCSCAPSAGPRPARCRAAGRSG